MTRTESFRVLDKPHLTANQRLHWAQRAAITKRVRAIGYATGNRFGGTHDHVTVAMTWKVTTRHRRDTDNTVPTLKALCDGLVDAGLVVDDTPQWMTKHMPAIEHVTDKNLAGIWLTITVGEARE